MSLPWCPSSWTWGIILIGIGKVQERKIEGRVPTSTFDSQRIGHLFSDDVMILDPILGQTFQISSQFHLKNR